MIKLKIGFWCIFFLLIGTAKTLKAGAFNQAIAPTALIRTSVWSVEKNMEVSKISEKQSKEIKRKLKKSRKLASKSKSSLSPKQKIGVWFGALLSIFALLGFGIGLVQSVWIWVLAGAAAGLLLTVWWVFRIFNYSDKDSAWVIALPTVGYVLLGLELCILGYFWGVTWALLVGLLLLLSLYILVKITQPNTSEEPAPSEN
jgi:uncharacterized membrane protein